MRKRIIGILVMGLAVAGCAVFQKSSTTDTEGMLSAAGFKVKLADTPEKLSHLKTLPQHRVFPQERDGRTYYLYADAAVHRQLFIGDEEAYQAYQIILQQKKEDALDQELTQKEHDDAVIDATASMDWDLWWPDGVW